MIDDYDEDKFLEEITARGLKPGDYVGDLQETSNVAAEAAALNATATREAGKQERSAGLGMYRAGGPTTIFGGSGWGPYSDGPLNAVRKSLYNREGLNEENWMYVSAQRTIEENETWKQLRRDALAGYASIWGDSLEPPGSPKRGIDEIVVDDSEVETKRRKLNEGSLPLGMYDAQTGLVFCECASLDVPFDAHSKCRSCGHSTYGVTMGMGRRWEEVFLGRDEGWQWCVEYRPRRCRDGISRPSREGEAG